MAPLHDYECTICHKRFEVLVRKGEAVKCECGSDQLQLRVSTHASYKIKGNNSASTTPKKFKQ